MFKRNDYALFAARILLICNFIIGILLCLIISIWLAVKIHWTWLFLIFPMLGVVCGSWIIGRLILSFFCDTKLIRNKLYENSNQKLEVFFKLRKNIINSNIKNDNDDNEKIITSELSESQQSLHKEAIDSDGLENENTDSIDKNEDSKEEKSKITKANIISVAVAIVLSLTVILVIMLTRIL